MDARTMTTIAAVCIALGAGFMLGRSVPAEAPASAAPPRDGAAALPSSAPNPPADELAGLRACVHKLGEAEARIDRGCAATAAAGTFGVPSGSAPIPVATAEQGAPAAASAPTAGAGATAATAEPSATTRAFSQGFMAHVVGTTDAESRWLQEYVCLVDDRRKRTEGDLSTILGDPQRASDHAALDSVVAESKVERDAMLADIEARLGKDRYKRVRDLGGLGILSRSCPAHDPQPPR